MNWDKQSKFGNRRRRNELLLAEGPWDNSRKIPKMDPFELQQYRQGILSLRRQEVAPPRNPASPASCAHTRLYIRCTTSPEYRAAEAIAYCLAPASRGRPRQYNSEAHLEWRPEARHASSR